MEEVFSDLEQLPAHLQEQVLLGLGRQDAMSLCQSSLRFQQICESTELNRLFNRWVIEECGFRLVTRRATSAYQRLKTCLESNRVRQAVYDLMPTLTTTLGNVAFDVSFDENQGDRLLLTFDAGHYSAQWLKFNEALTAPEVLTLAATEDLLKRLRDTELKLYMHNVDEVPLRPRAWQALAPMSQNLFSPRAVSNTLDYEFTI